MPKQTFFSIAPTVSRFSTVRNKVNSMCLAFCRRSVLQRRQQQMVVM
jgi:hypothetical protein